MGLLVFIRFLQASRDGQKRNRLAALQKMPDGIARKSSSAAKALLGAELRIGVGQLTQWYRDNGTKKRGSNPCGELSMKHGGAGTIPAEKLGTLNLSNAQMLCFFTQLAAMVSGVATRCLTEKAEVEHVGNYESVQVEEMLPQRGFNK